MSIKVMAEVWEHAPCRGGELLFLLALADQAGDDDRIAWPGMKTLMKKCRGSRASVYNYASNLQTLNIIEQIDQRDAPSRWRPARHGGHDTILWRIRPRDEWVDAKSVSGPDSGPLAADQQHDAEGSNFPVGGVQSAGQEATSNHQQTRKKKTTSPSSSRTRSRSSHDDGPDQSLLDELGDAMRPGSRPEPVANTRRVTRGRKSPTEHIHAPERRDAGGLACYWGRELEQVGSLEKSEEAIVGKYFKEWLGRGLDVNLARKMIDLFFADPELYGSTHRWKRFVSNAETLRQRVLANYGGVIPGVDDVPAFDWTATLPAHLRERAREEGVA